jgi:hypothetical protein
MMRYLIELFQALLFAALISLPFTLYFWSLTP